MGLHGSPFESAATDPKICAQTSPTADGWELERAAEEPWPPPIQRAKGGEDRRWPLLAKVGQSCPQKSAETLSSQYGLHLLLAGLLLMFAWAVHAVGVAKSAVLAYLLSLMALQLLWMAWYLCRRCAHKKLIQDKDTQAGARWLKCEWGGAGARRGERASSWEKRAAAWQATLEGRNRSRRKQRWSPPRLCCCPENRTFLSV